jgi:hypothetical protein
MRASLARALAVLVFGSAALGCSEDAVEVEQRSLQASSEVTFVCATRPASGEPLEGREQSACPDFDSGLTSLFALVTQTATDEVAIVDVESADVVDVDPRIPGFSLLRVPSRPGDIVTTPGGAATFVGLTGVAKTGIAAIPTTCLDPPGKGHPVRDVTTFAACRLPGPPGDMVVLVEPPDAEGIRTACDAASPLESSLEVPPGAVPWMQAEDGPATGRACPANLTTEPGPAGRRKLVVTLPDSGELVVIDAQGIVDGVPGTFEDCHIEARLPLRADVHPAGVRQTLPPDLELPTGCEPTTPLPPPARPSYQPRPAGLAFGGGHLYLADQGAPVVHVVDAASPCALAELPPLLPLSFEDPARVVTTSRLAVSPLTSSGKRFVYAIDEFDQPMASIMAFDVSPGSLDRTPIVRPGSTRTPFEPPDRVQLGGPAADVTFALRDLPLEDLDTQVAVEGVLCDPDPTLSTQLASTRYRPASDFSSGARPRLLRGLFALVVLTSGQIAVIDVDDFDAPCRRPVRANHSPEPDFRGCANDPGTTPFFTSNEVPELAGQSQTDPPTVSNEVSCNMVEPHRLRSQSIGVASATLGIGAPSLRALPRFSAPDDDVVIEPGGQPKLLAVDFAPPQAGGVPDPALVYVGTTLFQNGLAGAELPMDPNTAEESSVVLPLAEPRSFLPGDSFQLAYEGRVTGDGEGGFLSFGGDAGSFEDRDAYFCGQGVYDVEMMRDYGEKELDLAPAMLDAFAETHADYVQVTDGFPALQDSYWLSERGQDCGGRSACFAAFGRADARDLDANRELTIEKAFQDRLVVRPRNVARDELQTLYDQCTRCDADPGSPACTVDGVAKDKLTLLWEHCFPGGMRYTVRASKQWVLRSGRSLHDVTAALVPGSNPPAYECVRDCNPRKRLLKSRAFEISSSTDCVAAGCGVGVAPAGDVVCTFDATPAEDGARSVVPGGPGSSCVFENLVARFAVYRGRTPSVRGMAFSWQTAGGFIPLVGTLTTASVAIVPQHITYLPEYQTFAVVDAGTGGGLSLLSLDTLRINAEWPVH